MRVNVLRTRAGMLSGVVLGAALAAAGTPAASAQSLEGTTGTYKVVMEMEPSLPDHTVYRPADMAAVQETLPIVVFGNGACVDQGNAFKPYLGEIASHGFLIVANGPIAEGGMAAPPKPGEPMPQFPRPGAAGGAPGGPPAFPHFKQSRPGQLIEAMDWAVKQNGLAGSRYYGKLDTSAIATMGQSCGGLEAMVAAADPRVRTAVIMNSGIIRGGRAPIPGLTLPGSEDTLKHLHAPMIYIIGGETDIAYKNSETDFAALQGIPVFDANLLGVGHGGTYWEPHGGRFAEVASQWLLWQLKGDKAASTWFVGDACGLCTNTQWNVKRKNISAN